VRLPKADDVQAISLVANGLGQVSATLYVDDEAVARAFGSEIALPVPIGDLGATLRLRFDGAPADAKAGLAVYTQTGELPPGVTSPDKSAIFRDRVGGNALVTAAFAEPGSAEVTRQFDGRPSDVAFASYCSAATSHGLELNVSLDGDTLISGPCDDADSDAAGSTYTLDPSSAGAADSGAHTIRAFVTRGVKGPEVTPEDVTLGFGVYRKATEQRDVLGMSVDEVIDFNGRTWQLERVVPDSDGHDVTVSTADGDRLVGLVAHGDLVSASWDGRLDSGEGTRLSSGQALGSASTVGGVLLRGDTYQVRINSEHGAPFEGSLLVYRPL
jgi:hypothetical protein